MLLQLLYAHAHAEPDRTAVVYRDERLGFGELVERIERLADGLAGRGIKAGDSVALVLRDDPWFLVAFHAVAALGATVVPANPGFKQAELEFWFRRADVDAVISDDRAAGVCQRIVAGFEREVEVIGAGTGHGHSITLEGLLAAGTARRLAPRPPEEPLVGHFSSGSTGTPKLLYRTHGQCVAEAENYLALGLTGDDRVLATTPLFSSFATGSCISSTAISGATLVILEDPHPFLLKRHRALELIESERITVYPGVPFNYRLLADSPTGADLSSLRLAFSSGVGLPRETFESFGERFGVLVRQVYGSTETGLIAANLSDDPVSTFASVGRPMPTVEVAIVDDDGAEVPTGVTGEITVVSPSAAYGYADMPGLDEVSFREGRFFTGDLGRLDEDGLLCVVGRKKLLIEVGGFKVDPIEVEAVLDSHPCVGQSIVVGVDTEIAGEQRVKAVIVADGPCEQREISAFCRERLANFKVPQEVEFREQIPTNPLGKVLRKYLV